MLRGALVSLLAAAVIGAGGTVAWRHYASTVHTADLLGDAARGQRAPREITIESAPRVSGGPGPVRSLGGDPDSQPGRNVLLAGLDARPGEDRAAARADTVMVVHVSSGGDRAWLLSLPRDTRVDIPGHGTDKLNAAYADGGFPLLAETVRELTGLVFDAGVVIDFAGLRKVVDAVGGVDLCVDVQTTSVHVGWDAQGRETPPYRLVPPTFRPEKIPGVRAQVYPVGCRHFAGWEALDYVRQRELLPDGDYGRQRHQQQLIKAVGDRVTSAGVLSNPIALDRTLNAVGGAVTFDGNGASVTDWLLRLRGLRPSDVTMLRTNGGQFNSVPGASAYELLDPASTAMFAAARADRLDAFTETHPAWVIK